LAQARELDRQRSVEINYVQAYAENTGMADKSFDVVTAGQCWHWFKRDRAAQEARRILRTNGVLVIAHFDWLPLSGSVVAATEALILAHNPQWSYGGGNGIYGRRTGSSLCSAAISANSAWRATRFKMPPDRLRRPAGCSDR
jgi:SAM-dependent methyltransferase